MLILERKFMYTIVFVDFLSDVLTYKNMKNECKKCKVVHNSLAEKCFSCGGSLKSSKTQSLVFGIPALIATTFLSLSVVVLNLNTLIGG